MAKRPINTINIFISAPIAHIDVIEFKTLQNIVSLAPAQL
jgi:hypothetical protein